MAVSGITQRPVRPPTMFWQLNDAAGSNKLDYMGVRDLVEQGAVTSQSGGTFFAGAAFLQPTTVGGQATLIMPTGDCSIAGWFYPDTDILNNQYLFSFGATTAAQCAQIHLFGSSFTGVRFYTAANSATFAETTNAPTLNAWNFVAAWHDASAGTVNVQLNGDTAASAAGAALVAQSYTRFGRASSDAANLAGGLKLWGVWPYVLTDDERAYLFAGGYTMPQLLGYEQTWTITAEDSATLPKGPIGVTLKVWYGAGLSDTVEGTINVLDASDTVPATWTGSTVTVAVSDTTLVQGSAFSSTLTFSTASGSLGPAYVDWRLSYDPQGSATNIQIQLPFRVVISGEIRYTEYPSGVIPRPTPIWAGVTVSLFDSTSALLATTITDAAGLYQFVGTVAEGTDVYVKVLAQLPPGEAINETATGSTFTVALGVNVVSLICDRAPI